MIWQRGRVCAVDSGRVRVRFENLQHCRRCLRGEGCGAGVFSRLFSPRGADLELPHRHGLVQGQAVRVGVSERELVASAVLIYGLPLLAFILAAAAAAKLASSALASDLVALVAGLAAATLCLLAAGRLRWRILNPRVEPLSADSDCAALESASN